ncbi:helix-turn-helix domain-containing protein [Levilactobacillus brevis]|nr:helix-turn-helix domain-containing protein [Levilactobacillus brevis]
MIINKDVMRDHNERSVLQAIVNHGPISRTEVSKLLGLNKVTVSDIIGSLTERKLVTSQGEARRRFRQWSPAGISGLQCDVWLRD